MSIVAEDQLQTEPLNLRGKRIIVVLKTMALGGAERQALILTRYLLSHVEADVQVWAFRQGKSDSLIKICDRYNVTWRIIPFRLHNKKAKLLRDMFRLWLQFKHAKPDILLPYLDIPNIACGLLWRLIGAETCIWSERNIKNSSHQGRKIMDWAVQLTPLFVANSRQGANYLVNEIGAPEERVRVVYNGVQLSPPVNNGKLWRQRLGLSKQDFVGCIVAHLNPDQKDHETLIQAWSIVVGRLFPLGCTGILLCAGRLDGSEILLEEMCVRLNISTHVRFLGEVEDVPGLLDAVDLGVLCSRYEGLPNSVLEYMAAGLPAVGTDIAGIREALGSQNYRYLAPPNDPERLAKKILLFAEDRKLRESVGTYNRQRAESMFSPTRMCTEMAFLLGKRPT